MAKSLIGVLYYLSCVLAGFYFGVIYIYRHYSEQIGVIANMTYLFGVIAIFDKRLIGK